MRQSVSLIQQCINNLPAGIFKTEDTNITSPLHPLANRTMEMVIDHFKFYCDGFTLPEANSYICTETPKGEFGVFLVTNDSSKPYRCKIRSPGYFHLQSLDFLSYKLMLADLVAIIGSIDIVFGEIDR
jgi:NADH:ubiquinone oxidoreductase subunit D